MDTNPQKQRGLIVGALIGAILGAGAAYLLMTAPADPEDKRKPLTGGELLSLTSAAAILIRKLDDVRRRV
jgi:gas vesicle protein